MQKIILFYKFTPVEDPHSVRLWQRTLCEKLNLQGRIIIAEHGINGTLGGDVKDLKAFIRAVKEFTPFKSIAFKWSEGTRGDFPKLSVKVRPEIVTFGMPDKINVDQNGIVGGGKHLKPKQVHELLRKRGQEVVFFDGRNSHEAAIGRFRNAVVPAVRHTRDFAKELDNPKYAAMKNKPVVTYCTGGIRCEVLSMLMKEKGFNEVYQIDGGIVKYGEEFGDEGLWEGSLYVFDSRLATNFSEKAKVIGECSHCGSKTSNYINCADVSYNDLVLVCEKCADASHFCARHLAAAVK